MHMRAEFESGAWADLPDPGTMTARDKAVWSAATFMPYDMSRTGKVTQISLGNISRQLNTMLAHFITAWSYPWILPSQDLSADDDGTLTYEQSLMNLPIDDYNELEAAAEPLLEKLRGGPKGTAVVTTSTSSSSSSKAPRAGGRKSSRTTPSPSASSS
jgi:hypothetical protein